MGIAWDSHRALGGGDLSLSVRLVPLSGLCSAIACPALNPVDRHFAGLLPLSLLSVINTPCINTHCLHVLEWASAVHRLGAVGEVVRPIILANNPQ